MILGAETSAEGVRPAFSFWTSGEAVVTVRNNHILLSAYDGPTSRSFACQKSFWYAQTRFTNAHCKISGPPARSGEGLEGWYSWLRGEIRKSREAAFA
jgi:hypothetical protein